VDEETMSPGHWLGLLLYVSFSALTLMVGWQEGQLAHRKPAFTNSRGSLWEEEDPTSN